MLNPQYEKLEPTIKKHVHTCVAACLTEVATGLRAMAQQIEQIGADLSTETGATPEVVAPTLPAPPAAPEVQTYLARECIKPSCHKVSKGPRYWYCCETHRHAPKEMITYWQALARGEKPAKPQLKAKPEAKPAKGVTITKAEVTKAAAKKSASAKKTSASKAAKSNGSAEPEQASA